MRLVCIHDGVEKDVLLHAPGHDEGWQFGIETKDGIELCDSARVAKGKPGIPSVELAMRHLEEAGYGWAKSAVEIKEGCLNLKVIFPDSYSWSGNRDKMSIAGKLIDRQDYNLIWEPFGKVARWHGVVGASVRIADKRIPMQKLLEIIGEGRVVTALSLAKGCLAGQARPPFLPGDRVKGPFGEGVLEALNAKAKVRLEAGKYVEASWSSIELIADEAPTRPSDLHESLDANFASVLSRNGRIYRAATKVGNWSCPVFPMPDEKPHRVENTVMCDCPICGWPMAASPFYREDGVFVCCMCKQRAFVIDNSVQGEISLLMMKRPSKNHFCLPEVRCCSNCGLFEFEVGREGKRSTGYCQATNQCVQGFNSCAYRPDGGWWFPRDPKRYASNMKQHVTNLGYGVDDRRNTSRKDIRDTVYRADDHQAEKVRADKAVDAYRRGHRWFVLALKEKADKEVLHEKATDEVREQYGRVLDEE
jgi:hypothetical protein